MIKSILSSLAFEKAPGPQASFTVLDVIRFLHLLGKFGCIGRGRIAEKLSLGEGTTRTILKRLAESGLIVKSRSGCSFTYKGRELWEEIERIIPQLVEVESNELTFADYSVAALVRGRAEKIRGGLEQRDAAVMFGARGAVTIIVKGNKLIIPGVSMDLKRDYPSAFEKITRLMEPKEGDVVIISSASTIKGAEYGALAAAWSII